MKLIVKYADGIQFSNFYEYVYSVDDEYDKPMYRISIFVDDDGKHDAYIVNEQTGQGISRKGRGLTDCMTLILSEVSKTYPNTKLFMVGEQ